MNEEGRLIAGRYRLGQRIGSGAMGVVWQAHDERLHRKVAIKQLLLQPGLSAADANEARQRAMREGRIAARLQHPNAIAVYDVAEADGQPWLVMEYLPSQSLSAVLSERGTLPPPEAARIGAHVAAALAAAHAAGIVHRDIKPGNVLLGDDGTVKITDFGISRATGDVQITATGMLAGTPAYLAPEVAKGYDPGPPSDVFSLGAMIYATVEGEPPFGLNENTLALLHLVAAGKVNPPQQAGPLAELLMQLLRAEPTERPTMPQANEGFAAVAAGRPVPPHVFMAGSGQTWRSSQPTVAVGSDAPTHALGPAGAGQTRLNPRPFDGPQTTARVGAGHPGTRPPGSRPPAAYPAEEPPSRSRKRPWLIGALAVAAAAVVGILLAGVLFNSNPSPSATPLSPSSSTTTEQTTTPTATPTTTTPKKPTTTQSTPTTTSTTSTTASSQPSAQEVKAFITNYYTQAPKHPDQTYNMLTPNYQAQIPGGLASYKQYWSQFDSASVAGGPAPTQSGGTTFEVALRYKAKNGTQGTQVTLLTLVTQGGKLMIDQENQIQPLVLASDGGGAGTTSSTVTPTSPAATS